MLGHFQIYVVLFKWSLSRSVGEKGSVYMVRRGRVRRSQKYNNTVRVVQEIAFMAKGEKVSGCFYISQALCYKRPESVSPAFFAQRKREGRIANAGQLQYLGRREDGTSLGA